MRVRWTRRALADLREIGIYIRSDNPDAARRWVARLRDRAVQAAEAPRSGRVVPEFGRADLREVFLRSYRIVYAVHDDGIEIVTVFEGHQLFPLDVGKPPSA
jgi:toxin ParE1/3/4